MQQQVQGVQLNYLKIENPIFAIGREFVGPYLNASDYAEEVQRNLIARGIKSKPMSVLAIFFDDPSQTAPQAQRSFHAALVDDFYEVEEPYRCVVLQGNFLYAKTVGPNRIAHAYQALSQFATDNNVKFAEIYGYQVMTFPDNVFTVEILYKLAEEE